VIRAINLDNDDMTDPDIQYTDEYLQELKQKQLEANRIKKVFQIKKKEIVHLPIFILVPKGVFNKISRSKKTFNQNTFQSRTTSKTTQSI
jgi:hypothetical protein